MSMPPFLVVSGSSGSGKTTICRELARRHQFVYLVSHTTRPKRPGEEEGKHYHFLSRKEFQKKIDAGEFLEWAEVYGNLYGTSRVLLESYLNAGKGVIVDVDTQGALNLKASCPKAVLVFVMPPSPATLKERLLKRATDSLEIIEARLKHSQEEESKKSSYDYVVVNHNVEDAVSEIEQILSLKSC